MMDVARYAAPRVEHRSGHRLQRTQALHSQSLQPLKISKPFGARCNPYRCVARILLLSFQRAEEKTRGGWKGVNHSSRHVRRGSEDTALCPPSRFYLRVDQKHILTRVHLQRTLDCARGRVSSLFGLTPGRILTGRRLWDPPAHIYTSQTLRLLRFLRLARIGGLDWICGSTN